MSFPYLGEIRLFAFGRTPEGWFSCDGSLLPIASYSFLYNVLGTTYGGDGVTTFGVPDLRGRVPVSQGQGPLMTQRLIGETGGTETVTLTTAQMPAHRHALSVTTAIATSATPGPTLAPGTVSGDTFHATDIVNATAIALGMPAIAPAGGSLPHANTMPTVAMHYCIALNGVYPTAS